MFFLKREGGKVQKAYWGGVAVFPKNHFNPVEEKNYYDTVMEKLSAGSLDPRKVDFHRFRHAYFLRGVEDADQEVTINFYNAYHQY